MTTAAIIVAAGSGQRFGHAGKSFAPTYGVPMARWSLEAALNATTIDEIVLVCGEHSRSAAVEVLNGFAATKPMTLALGGARRQDSALAGIAATSADVVAIHDAARPLVDAGLFDLAVKAAWTYGAAIVAIPVADTIKRVADNVVQQTVSREDLVAVQTPQAFRTSLLLEAFAAASETDNAVTDEATLIESLGHPVHVVPGRSDNIKVTYPSDLAVVEALLKARAG